MQKRLTSLFLSPIPFALAVSIFLTLVCHVADTAADTLTAPISVNWQTAFAVAAAYGVLSDLLPHVKSVRADGVLQLIVIFVTGGLKSVMANFTPPQRVAVAPVQGIAEKIAQPVIDRLLPSAPVPGSAAAPPGGDLPATAFPDEQVHGTSGRNGER